MSPEISRTPPFFPARKGGHLSKLMYDASLVTIGCCLKSKLKVFISSIKTTSCVDKSKICRFCGPGHNEEIINRELKRFLGTGLLLSTKQRELLDVTREFCQNNDFELEVIDMTDLAFFDKMKLVFKGIRAPAICYEGNRVEGAISKERLEVLLLGKA